MFCVKENDIYVDMFQTFSFTTLDNPHLTYEDYDTMNL